MEIESFNPILGSLILALAHFGNQSSSGIPIDSSLDQNLKIARSQSYSLT